MPYKNKEDKTEQQRRYRERKREEKEMAEKVECKVGNILKVLGFKSMTSNDFIRMILKNCVLKEGIIIERNTGKELMDDAVVYMGRSMLVTVSDPLETSLPKELIKEVKNSGTSGEH